MLIIKNAACIALMDDAATRIVDGAILCDGPQIHAIGPSDSLPSEGHQVVDARGMLLMPGLVNTHHHFFQTLTRCVPAAQNAGLFGWLRTLYPIWAGITPDAMY